MTQRIITVSLCALAAACAAPADIDRQQHRTTSANAMTWNAMTWNAMTWNGASGSVAGNEGLPGWALDDATLWSGDQTSADNGTPGDTLEAALATPEGAEFMKYLVSCALPAGVSITGPDLSELDVVGVHTFEGGVGLCPQWNEIDSFDEKDRVSLECQELVSACLLARTNAFGIAVPISFRGIDVDGTPLPLASAIKGGLGDLGASQFEVCWPPWTVYGDRECGWSDRWVGTCSAGDSVQIEATCTTSAQMARVCEGTRACSSTDAILFTDTACEGPFTFTCPESEDYVLMTAPYATNGAANAAWSGINTSVPTTELELFDWREGGFYGNIFDTDNLRIDTTYNADFVPTHYDRVTGAVIDPNTFAPGLSEPIYNLASCYDTQWNDRSAHYLHRVCVSPSGAGSGYQCAARVAGACQDLCATDDNSTLLGDGDFDDCNDNAKVSKTWTNPLTVFLNHPCDTLPGFGFCQ